MSFIKELFKIDVITDKEYKENKKKIYNHSLLTFDSYQEDLKIRENNLRYKSVKNIFIILFLGLIFLVIMLIGVKPLEPGFIENHAIISALLLSIAIIYLILLLNEFMRFLMSTWIIKFPKIGIIGLPLITFLFFYKLFNDIIPNSCELYRILTIIIISVISIFQSMNFYKNLPNYLDVELSDTVTFFLSIITILTKVFSFPLPLNIDTCLVILIVNLNFVSLFLKFENKKNKKKAKEIFMNQLLSEEINYESLLKCYAIGGNEYKDKIMENERFLRKINSEEIKKNK